MSAIRNEDGSVLVNGVRLTAAEVEAVKSAKPVFRPLLITTGSGRKYGHNGEPRYGVFFNGTSWFWLDKNCRPMTSVGPWAAKNLSRASLTFNKPS